ncbi:effector-associated constant component EACC1 [Streptomyces sp. 8N616]|uniref:effector-associated constant component EACC1 n=1 Tax=Streptomyces sp. 8N616 TaxID=3457414 RepID=UPI003FD4E5F0
MDLTVEVTAAGVTGAGAAEAADELRSLHGWLAAEEELRGRVWLVEQPPRRGTLGSVPETLAVVLAPGGASAVLASAVISWMRHRTGEVVCKVTRPDGAGVEVSAQRVRSTDMAEVRELVGELSRLVDSDPPALEQGALAAGRAGSSSPGNASGQGCS